MNEAAVHRAAVFVCRSGLAFAAVPRLDRATVFTNGYNMTDAPDLSLFHAPHTRSIRVLMLLDEMGLEHAVEAAPYHETGEKLEAYKKYHPLGKIPALRDGDDAIFESNAILQYILGRYGPSDLEVKPDEADYGRYLQWLHFGEGGMTIPVSLLLAHTFMLPEDQRNPGTAKWARGEVDKTLSVLGENGLDDGREYLAGNRFTAADISVVYMLYLLKLIKQFDGAPENVKAYFKRITSRDSWKKATG